MHADLAPFWSVQGYNSGMDIQELRSDQPDRLEQALWIYAEAFPAEERDAPAVLLAAVRQREAGSPPGSCFHFQLALEGESVLAIAIFQYYQTTRMGFIPYFAVHPQRRNGGLGARIYPHIIATCAADALRLGETAPLGVSFEVEQPKLARTPAEAELRRRRIGFYLRNGALLVPHLRLVAPPLGPNLPEMPYTILLHPLSGWRQPPGRAELEAVVATVLGQGYGLPPENPHYQRALASIDLP